MPGAPHKLKGQWFCSWRSRKVRLSPHPARGLAPHGAAQGAWRRVKGTVAIWWGIYTRKVGAAAVLELLFLRVRA